MAGIWDYFKRNTDDPLLRRFLDKYGFHLLSIPRERINVGELYICHDKSNRVSSEGSIGDIFEPPIKIEADTSEIMADITEISSHSVSKGVGIGILESFLNMFGAGSVVSQVRGAYEGKNMAKMKFRFSNPTLEALRPSKFGLQLMKCKFNKRHPLYDENFKFYAVTAAARTSSLSIVSQDEKGRDFDLDLQAMHIADVSGKFSVKKSGEGEITYCGQNNVTFAVELHELKYDLKRNGFRLLPAENTMIVRKVDDKQRESHPAFVGDKNTGDISLVID